jgi:hypothetical protein
VPQVIEPPPQRVAEQPPPNIRDEQATAAIDNVSEPMPDLQAVTAEDPVADVLSVPDADEWNLDAELSMDIAPVMHVHEVSVDKVDPVLVALEQWLSAIVADRANSR